MKKITFNDLNEIIEKWNKKINSANDQEMYQLEIKEYIDIIYNDFIDKVSNNNFISKNKEVFILFFYNTLLMIMFLKLLQKNNLIFHEFVYSETKINKMRFKEIKNSLNYNQIKWKNKKNIVSIKNFDSKVVSKFESEFMSCNNIGKKLIDDIKKIKHMRDNNSIAHVFTNELDKNYFVNEEFSYLNLLKEVKDINVIMDKNEIIIERELMNNISFLSSSEFFQNEIINEPIVKQLLSSLKVTPNINDDCEFNNFMLLNLFFINEEKPHANENSFKLWIINGGNIEDLLEKYLCFFEKIKEKIMKTEFWCNLIKERRDFEFKIRKEEDIFEIEKYSYFLFIVKTYSTYLIDQNDNKIVNDLFDIFFKAITKIMYIEEKHYYNFSRWNFIINSTHSFFTECIKKTINTHDWNKLDDFMNKNEFKSNEYSYWLKKFIKGE